MSALQTFRQWAATSTVAHVSFGFLAMGGWAMFANRAHLPEAMLLAGVVQGTISGLLTLGLKKFLEWLNGRMTGAAALIGPPAITATTIFAILFSAHTLAGTPALWATIAVPFAVSTSYASLYNLRLSRERSK
jgi:mannose/fructose/N-acetylgalactosamine-specific phosphotransferase system component IIC